MHRRRWFLTFASLLSLATAFSFVAQAQTAKAPKRVALVVGIGEYDHREWITLMQTENDADGLAAELRRLEFDKVVVMKGTSPGALRATAKNIIDQLDLLLKDVTKNDIVLVALSGHGQQVLIKQESGEFVEEDFFCPVEAVDGKADTMLKIATLTDDVLRKHGGRNLLLIDACRDNPEINRKKGGGRFKGVQGRDMTLPRNTAILFSCGEGQQSLERDDIKHSVFTLSVIEALQAGRTSWLSLADYVQNRVPQLNEIQTPIATGSIPLVNLAPTGGAGNVTADIVTSVVTGMKLKRIKAGEFMMGSDASDPDGQDDEFIDAKAGRKEKHRVRITRPFYLGVTEVTRGQFRRFVDDENYQTDAEKDGKGGYGWNEETKKFEQNPKHTWRNAGFEPGQTDDHPVVNVSWNDAVAFARWLSRKEGKTYRLPTEAEWEYACRAGTATRFANGEDVEGLARVGNVADATAKAKYPDWTWAITASDGYVYTAPVGLSQPNAFGLFDMHGNVWEWCSDWYSADYYKQSPVDDPPGAPQASYRVFRGGGWYDYPRYCRSAYRDWDTPEDRSDYLGFRLALVQSGG
jgi:formylglycine-generating enzyme required for sulfatase activity